MSKSFLVSALLLVSVAASAEGPRQFEGRGFGAGGGQGRGRFLEELDLSPEQRSKLQDLRGERGAKWEAMREMREARDRFDAKLKDYSISEAKLRAEANKFATLHSQMQAQRFEHLLELRKILSPEQLGKFIDKMHERRQGMKGAMAGGNQED